MSSCTTLIPNDDSSFSISQLPSVKSGSMTIKEEASKRRRTCRYIEEAGRLLKLPRVTISTAMLFFHRFYAKHSFVDHDRFEVSMAAILLAAKTEESPRKLNNVIDECQRLKIRGLQQGVVSSTSIKSDDMIKLKERVLLLERVLLHTIGFELSVDHPYKFIVDQIKLLVQKRMVEYASSSSDSLLPDLIHSAMNFCNDSMQTTLCLQFTPVQIASSTIYLAGQFKSIKPSNGKDWLEILSSVDAPTLASICLQIIEPVAERKSDTTQYTKIKSDIERLQQL